MPAEIVPLGPLTRAALADATNASQSCQGLHRHALMTMIAYAFFQYRRIKTARPEKKNQRAAASADPARRAPRHPRALRSTTAAAMSALSKMDSQGAAA
jgi:hypothetical protein